MAVVLWLVATATFALMHCIPGGPFDRERAVPEAVQEAIAKRYNLDDSFLKQYADYIVRLAHFDLGPSLKHQDRTVNDIIKGLFPLSAMLGFFSVALSLLVGIPLGIISALRRNGWIDHAAMAGAISLVSVPSFVLATLLIFLFASRNVPAMQWLPSSWVSYSEWDPPSLWDRGKTLVIPVVSLAGFSLAYITRLTRASFIEVLKQDYIRTARAKGLGMTRVIVKHGLKNGLTPVVTYLGPLIAAVFTGSFVIERIYGIPGLGRFFVTSIYNRDYPVILGVTIFYCALLVTMNLIVDLIYMMLDPRVRLGSAK